jgi:PAS domain S-box-containing protein
VALLTPSLARSQLADLFDASPEPFTALTAIRGHRGIQDFRFVYANPAALSVFHRKNADEVEGRRLLEIASSHGPTSLFDHYVQVVETGEAQRNTFFYAGDRVSGWFRSLVVKWGDGVTITFQDQTDEVARRELLTRKAAEGQPTSAERDLLEAMLRHLPARVVLFSLPDFVFEYVNDAFVADGLGRDLIGRRVAEVFPQFMDHPLAAAIRRALATGQPYVNPEVPLRLNWGQGLEERVFSVVYQPITAADGKPVALLGFNFDVTEQAQARACTEALLREKEGLAAQLDRERRWLEAVVTNVSQGLAVLAADGTRLFANPRMDELLGRRSHPDSQRLLADVLPLYWPDGERIPEQERPFQRAVATGQPVRNVPVVFPHPARGDVTLDVSVAPILDPQRAVTAAIITVDDVTERHRLERERAAALEAEREARLRAEALARDLARSEERFRSLVETSSQAIWTTDWQGRVLHPAAGWALLTGQTADQTRGHGWLDAIHPGDLGAMQELWREALRTRNPVNAYCRVRRPDGEWVECIARGVPLVDDDGRVREWVGTMRDVSVERREEAALRLLSSTGAELSSTLDVAETLRAVTRLAVPALADFCIVDALRDDGTRHRVAVGHAFPEDAELAEKVRATAPSPRGPIAEALRRLEPVLIPVAGLPELDATALDAAHRSLLSGIRARSMLAVPLLARGRPLGVIGFFYSRSDRRYGPMDMALAEEVCRRAALAMDNAMLYQRAEEANRAKDEFLATVSHELRTPLSAILGWTRLLRGGGLSAEKHSRALETLDRNARAQARLVEDLLDVSRIVSGKTRLQPAPQELARVVEAAVEALRPAAEAKDLTLVLSLDHTLVVAGDADRLQQISWNLVSNAIKFTPAGGRVDVGLRATDRQAELSVSDTGQGIGPDFLPHAFERFRQADSTATRSHGGLGLGLSIVRHLVELHGGTVAATSRGTGQGATFTVRIPLCGAPDGGRIPTPRTPAAGVPATLPSLVGVRVLVVDDDADMRELVSTVLCQQQAEVVSAGSAIEAMRLLARRAPHVIVADVAMPGEDGYQLLEQIRRLPDESGGRTPAVALTARSGAETQVRALAAGFQAHLPKPVEPWELVSAVADLIASSTTVDGPVRG